LYVCRVEAYQKCLIYKSDQMAESKTLTLFDHISGVTDKKRPWSSLSEADKKTVSPFMLNRFLSMNMAYTGLVNDLQMYTIGLLDPKEVYILYYELLPKSKSYSKYIKSSKESKYTEELIQLVAKHFSCSQKESIEYIELLFQHNKDSLIEIIKRYGKTESEISKIMKHGKD
jgi:hypothetical protein